MLILRLGFLSRTCVTRQKIPPEQNLTNHHTIHRCKFPHPKKKQAFILVSNFIANKIKKKYRDYGKASIWETKNMVVFLLRLSSHSFLCLRFSAYQRTLLRPEGSLGKIPCKPPGLNLNSLRTQTPTKITWEQHCSRQPE